MSSISIYLDEVVVFKKTYLKIKLVYQFLTLSFSYGNISLTSILYLRTPTLTYEIINRNNDIFNCI